MPKSAKIFTKQTISSVCRGVPLQYNLQLVENAVKAAKGSGAQNEEKVRWSIIKITITITITNGRS